MKPLETFIKRICGCYDNYAQPHTPQLPHAVHIVTFCNERILGLPKDFHGVFTIDETYDTYDSYSMELHHLYRYHELENGDIQLTSYAFVSEGTNEIAPGVLLHVVMHIYKNYYSVVEACYQNTQLVSGFEEPLMYRKADTE